MRIGHLQGEFKGRSEVSINTVWKTVLGFVIGVVVNFFILEDSGSGIELGNLVFGIVGALTALFLNMTKRQETKKG